MHNKAGGQIILVDHGLNLQLEIAKQIATDFSEQLPDLTSLHILAPTPDLSYSLRSSLLDYLKQQGKGSYIGGSITPLRKWVETATQAPSDSRQLINNHTRQLLILEALKQYPAHFEQENLWQVASTLLQLFDELKLQHIELDELSQEEWIERLKQLYQIENHTHLDTEAQLVYTLWQAWQTQLNDDQLIDRTENYIQRLEQLTHETVDDGAFYFAGLGQLTRHEILWIKKLSTIRPVKIFIQADSKKINDSHQPDFFFSELINLLGFETSELNSKQEHHKLYELAYHSSESFLERVKQLALEPVSNYQNLSLFVASSEEQEAIAIETQVRRWLLDGKRNIAVVTENRKLARRVRALLERAGVNLVDSVGWSLSTSSAATIIERWLECIEQDFSYQALLDLLKSPFFVHNSNPDKEKLLQAIYRFEQDIVIHANVAANLDRYRENLEYQQEKLSHWESDVYPLIEQLIKALKQQAINLKNAFSANTALPAQDYLELLKDSLDQLNITEQLAADEAGKKVLVEIEHMQQAVRNANPVINWYDFRTWVGSALEDHHYSPVVDASHVRLLNLQQSNSGHYEALILASVTAAEIPGKTGSVAFFNQNIRAKLGLPDWHQQKQFKFYLFRRLLESCDELLLSFCAEKNGEWQEPAPWLQSIISLFENAYSVSLQNEALAKLIRQPETEVLESTDVAVPVLAFQPLPAVNSDALPAHFSASRHQRLINCPYLFFCSDILGLRPQDDIIAELQKSEYGNKVHRILQLFHEAQDASIYGKPFQPGQFTSLLDEIRSISTRLFHKDIEDNFLHRGWLKRWLDHAESYLKWQSAHGQQWAFKEAEEKYKRELDIGITLEGRIDRTDYSNDGLSLIDYKTGSKTASQTDVETGEDVQLVSYALLIQKVIQVQYLKLDGPDGKVQDGAMLEGEQLHEIAEEALSRLQAIIEQLQQGQPLIANGAPEQCKFCQMSGICRKPAWSQAS